MAMGDDAEQPDDSAPTPERQADLRAAYEANVAAGRPPYAGVEIHTRGEVQWVLRERGWSAAFDPQHRPRVNLSGASFFAVNLRGVDLRYADLSGAFFYQADLSGADLWRARLSGAFLGGAHLNGASLRMARMDAATDLSRATLDGQTLLGDAVWNGVPVTRLNWADVATLGDEQRAWQTLDDQGKPKDRATRLRHFENAVLANRQVATLLRSQGLNEHADRFAYRAQILQRAVLRRQGEPGRVFGSWLLDVIAGYGYKPMRSVWTYMAVIVAFAAVYFSVANFAITPFLPTRSTSLVWYEALVLSISSFHGRGLFPSALTLGDPVAILAAGEAIIGLLIEITFIATFTQRFFAR
jgi:hypothetical protein